MRRGMWLLVCAALMVTLVAAPSRAAIKSERVASGLQMPVFCTAPAGDTHRVFILEQRGRIRILKDGALLGTPYLDIDALIPNISGDDERGLLGLAFHPDYWTNGLFYVNYTNLASDTIIARYQVLGDPLTSDIADPASALILMTIDQPFTNHNGGHVAFGPNDGYLYIGMGDGGAANDPGNRAQNDFQLLGKMLRVDVDCATPPCIPPDNPPGPQLDEIWAKGLRNPYRFSFDRQTADLYIADVGQNLWEEIDFQPAAETNLVNYGWRVMEGTHCFNNSTPPGCFDPSLTDPIHEYGHGTGRSITGGYVYRGVISEIQGHYFFADYMTHRIWSFKYENGQVTQFTERTAELVPDTGSISSISGFGEDGAGELYIVDRTGFSSGELYKIVPETTGVEVEPSPALDFSLSPRSENPFTGAIDFQVGLEREADLEVSVYTAAGRHVRTLHTGPAAWRIVSLTWDATDAAGRRVPPGVYFLRASSGGREAKTRVTLMR